MLEQIKTKRVVLLQKRGRRMMNNSEMYNFVKQLLKQYNATPDEWDHFDSICKLPKNHETESLKDLCENLKEKLKRENGGKVEEHCSFDDMERNVEYYSLYFALSKFTENNF